MSWYSEITILGHSAPPRYVIENTKDSSAVWRPTEQVLSILLLYLRKHWQLRFRTFLFEVATPLHGSDRLENSI
jgi:hypothetical protein